MSLAATRARPTLLGRLRTRWRELLRERCSPLGLAGAVFLGVLVGVSPFYGLQSLLVILLATLLRLNRLVALAAAQISLPPFYPFLVLASLEGGSFLLRGEGLGMDSSKVPETTAAVWALLADLGGVWLLGSLLVGALLGSLAGALVFVLALRREPRLPEGSEGALEKDKEPIASPACPSSAAKAPAILSQSTRSGLGSTPEQATILQ